MPQPEEAGTTRQSHRLSIPSKSLHRLVGSRIPDRFKDGDDAEDDVTAPPRSKKKPDAAMQYMHQSIFSMIAAAGSTSDFYARFDDSSDSDGDAGKVAEQTPSDRISSKSPSRQRGNEAPDSETPSTSDSQILPPRKVSEEKGRGGRRKLSEARLLRSIPNIRFKSPKRKDQEHKEDSPVRDRSASPGSPTPPKMSATMTPRSAPVLSRMIEAQNRYDTAVASPPDVQQPEPEEVEIPEDPAPSSLLSVRLKEIFGFEQPEKVIGEYPCWLMQSALLQGYMYITEGHVCFYAYLPQKSSTAVKSGNLSKRGRKNPKYNRYWFSLKGDVLSYYSDPSKLYFPSGHVDLRYGISASLSEQKDKSKEARDFTVLTDSRTYHFRADSAISAKEWVRALQNVIFRSHNEGARVKISLPIENVIDIEESPMIDFAETFSIRVLDSGESFAIDEYFFSFFDFGKDAFDALKSLINKHGPQDPLSTLGWKDGSPRGDSQSRDIRRRSNSSGRWSDAEASHNHRRRLSQKVKRTNRRQSEGMRRASLGRSQHDRSFSAKQQHDSSDSFVQSIDPTESSIVMQSTTDGCETASQILKGSDVFQSPTIHRLHQVPSSEAIDRRHSDDTARSMLKNDTLGIDNKVPSSKRVSDSQGASSESEPEVQGPEKSYAASAPKLQDIVKAGAYPLQRAAGFAEYLKSRSKQMSSLLATESMGYIEKVSGMWAGGGKHYAEGSEHLSENILDQEDIERGCSHGDRFRAHFALPPTEKLQATYFGYLHRVLPLYGKIYVGNTKFCFRSLLPGTRTKMILPIKDIENVEKEKGFRFGYQGLVVIIRGHEELFFEFNTSDSRDDCAVTLHQSLESVRYMVESVLLAQREKEDADAAKAEHQLLQEARLDPAVDDSQEEATYFDDTRASIINFKPTESLRITCLTIGSRGDVQPYIALCKGLLADGHKPKIATHREFEPWIRRHGIDFAPVEGDPAELMRICIENGMFTYSFLKEASHKFRGWIDELLSSAWRSCQGSDILIESPSAMAGIHIAEALRIPYFRAFSMPWTRTRAYPHAFVVPEHKMGGAYNYITYVMFDNVFWKGVSGQVNRWRKTQLGLRGTNLDKLQPNKVPFLYNFSPSLVPPPLDYPDWIRVTGYWFLKEGTNWTPPTELTDFIQKARQDGKKLIYVGFGSIIVSDPAALTKTIVESVQKADVRCILSKGWSDRLGDPASSRPEIPLPPEIHQIQSAPHDWLFAQMDAVVHHGGAGTTGASLLAGVPSIIKPFFGDQYFSGSRVEDLGVGICMKKLNVSVFSRAIWEATHSERMIVKARRLGEQVRKENGVETAIQAIYRDLEYAKTLTRQRAAMSSTPLTPSGGNEAGGANDEDLEDIEETWTFVDDDTDHSNPKRHDDPGDEEKVTKVDSETRKQTVTSDRDETKA